MKHPTPAELRSAILGALSDDTARVIAEHGAGADNPADRPIPVRVWRIVTEAISKACEETK